MQTELNPVEPTEEFSLGVWCLPNHYLMSDKPAIDGEATITYGDHWGEEDVSETVTDPTYQDLYMIASRLIQRSGDEHHVFIESFNYDSKNKCWQLTCGS